MISWERFFDMDEWFVGEDESPQSFLVANLVFAVIIGLLAWFVDARWGAGWLSAIEWIAISIVAKALHLILFGVLPAIIVVAVYSVFGRR